MHDERCAGLPLIILLFCTLLDIMPLEGRNSGKYFYYSVTHKYNNATQL